MSTSARVRRLACVFPAVVAVMLGACREEPWQEGLIWSPDGQHALMFRGGALYVMDAQGDLSAPMSSDLVGGAWLGDSERLVLVRRHRVRTFGELSAVIGTERTRATILRGDLLAHLVPTFPNLDDLDVDFGLFDTDPSAVLLYLQERDREVFDRIFPEAEPIDETQGWEEGILHSLSLARLVGKRVELGPTIYQDLGTIKQVRVAPGDRLIGFTQAADALLTEGHLSLRVAAIDASGSTTVADRDLAESFDWTADGRSLVYLAGSELRQDDAIIFKGEDKPRPVSSLAQVIFKPNARIRCLRDGRILFDAAELRYPTTHRPNTREQLFAVHRTGRDIGLAALVAPDTLKQLPESLAFFEVSPDGTHVLLAEAGAVVVLGLADGRLERLEQPAGLTSGRLPRPTWRAPGEFTYVRRTTTGAQLVLRRGHTDVVLSQSWPAETVNLLLGEVRPVHSESPAIARPGS